MLIDWFTVVAQLVNFAVLIWLLKRFLYRPVLDAMAAREQRVRETVAAADRQKAAAEAETEQLHAQQEALAQQKEALLQDARAQAAAVRNELLTQARQEAEARQTQLRQSLERDWREFREELARRTQDEALEVARQALRELADSTIEARMAEAFVKKLAALDGDAKAQLQSIVLRSDDPPLVRSGFELAAPVRERLLQALREQLAPRIELRFETSPGLIAGIEVAFDGSKIAWSFDDFLRSLEQDVRQLVEQQAKTHGASA